MQARINALTDQLGSPGTPPNRRPNQGLLIGGIVLFLSTYATNLTGVAGNALGGGPGREGLLAVPGAGPLILMAQTTNALGNFFLGADALAQVGSIAMIVYALSEPRPARVDAPPRATLRLVPLLGPDRTGLGLAGQF